VEEFVVKEKTIKTIEQLNLSENRDFLDFLISAAFGAVLIRGRRSFQNRDFKSGAFWRKYDNN